MIDYSHIPIHIRLTERWKIDPDYDAETYHKREHLIGRSRTGRSRVFHSVPDIVVDYLCELYMAHNGRGAIAAAAGAIGMPAVDLLGIVKTKVKKIAETTVRVA